MADEYILDTSRANQAQGRRRTSAVRAAAAAPSAVAGKVTRRSGSYSGKGMLTAELLAGFMIIAIRVVANYELQSDGTVKGKVLRPRGEYGPLTVFTGLILTFFVLSFLATSGGTKAKVAVITGGTVVLTLGLKSYDDVKIVAGTLGHIGQITVPDPSGAQSSVLGSAADTGAAGSSSSSGSSADQNPAGNSLTAGNRAIMSIQSPFTAILHGNFNIPKTVGSDALNLTKGLTDYINSGAQSIWGSISSDFSNAFSSLKNFGL